MLITLAACLAIAVEPVKLTPAEVAAGWTMLFDGTSSANFRGYKQQGFPAKGWSVEDGTLRSSKGGGGGDIITTQQYGDFELSLEYKCDPSANSGIIYRVTEATDATWQTGPEFQVFDDAGAKTKSDDPHSAGSLYDIIAPPADKVVKPAGEWNQARVRISGGLLQHYLNDRKVAECRIDDSSWKEMIAKSKFKDYPMFGVQPAGHIALQDHGDAVAYRNIKIRELAKPMPGEKVLWNGKDLTGWTHFLSDGGKPEDVWSAVDGVLVCQGKPAGYIRTTEQFSDYVLRFSWRFNPVTKQAGNSGVLLRAQAPDKVWPKSVEAQLQSGSAGDFWNIDSFPMTTDAARLKGRRTKHLGVNERPIGEWNDYEIIVNASNITLNINGQTLNSATGVEEVPGFIGLQSEGAEIHFKDVRVAPIAGAKPARKADPKPDAAAPKASS